MIFIAQNILRENFFKAKLYEMFSNFNGTFHWKILHQSLGTPYKDVPTQNNHDISV